MCPHRRAAYGYVSPDGCPQRRRDRAPGRAGTLRDVHVARLVRAARRKGVVLRLVPRIEDFVVPGTPVLAVHGGRGGLPSGRILRSAVTVGVQRTRRLVAGLDDLRPLVPEARREPLERHRALLVPAVRAALPEAAERAFALEPDRQGIGWAFGVYG